MTYRSITHDPRTYSTGLASKTVADKTNKASLPDASTLHFDHVAHIDQEGAKHQHPTGNETQELSTPAPNLLSPPLNTTLSDLRLHISSVYRTHDQAAFNDLHARTTKAGEGLSSFAEAVTWKKRDAESRKVEPREMRDVDECLNEDEWYHVQHENRVEEGEEYEWLCGERVRKAREEYEARVGWRQSEEETEVDDHESEVDGDEDVEQSDGRDESEVEWEDEVQTPDVNVREGLEDKGLASLLVFGSLPLRIEGQESEKPSCYPESVL
jgi:hypothetical protein